MLPLRDNVPTRRFPIVTVALIVANFAVWLFYELPDLNHAVIQLAFFPCEVENTCRTVGQSWEVTAVSSMFMHGSWLHILGNMLFLWIFGNNVEDALGHVGFFFWYLAAGVVAIAVQTAVTLAFTGEQGASIPNIGASGAIAGVLGVYFVLLPFARVLTLIFVVLIFIREIPAVWFLGIWILLQAFTGGLSLLHPQSYGGVAFFAHIGGFAFGLITGLILARSQGIPRPVQPL